MVDDDRVVIVYKETRVNRDIYGLSESFGLCQAVAKINKNLRMMNNNNKQIAYTSTSTSSTASTHTIG